MIEMRAAQEPFPHRGDEPHLLREIVRTDQVLMASFSRRTGMPASRFALMRLLAFAEGDVGVMDLARQLDINAAGVTARCRNCNEKGSSAADFAFARTPYALVAVLGLDHSHSLGFQQHAQL